MVERRKGRVVRGRVWGMVAASIGLSLSWGCKSTESVERSEPAVSKAPSASEATKGGASKSIDPAALVPNGRQPEMGLLVGGQPSQAQMRSLAKAGYRAVIDLRQPGEPGHWDEAALAKELSIDYYPLPIGGGDDLSKEKAEEFAAILEKVGDAPTLVHCASGNRVGALFALKAYYIDGVDADKAMAIGKKHGMRSLTAVVKEKLK